MIKLFVFSVTLMYLPAQINEYPWLNSNSVRTISDIKAPNGFSRIDVDNGSFMSWLRHLPLKPEGTPVLLHTNKPKPNQNVHHSVINIDIGAKNLQQCADATIRLRAEYLYSTKQYNKIHFNFTSGDRASFMDWANGLRPKISGNRVKWIQTNQTRSNYNTFKSYLKTVFMYAGTYSLQQELKKSITYSIGDVFIHGGFPGHAIIIVDKVENKSSGEIAILLAQSYMPAQNIHIVKNYSDRKTSPWYILKKGEQLVTPEWTFNWRELYRFD